MKRPRFISPKLWLKCLKKSLSPLRKDLKLTCSTNARNPCACWFSSEAGVVHRAKPQRLVGTQGRKCRLGQFCHILEPPSRSNDSIHLRWHNFPLKSPTLAQASGHKPCDCIQTLEVRISPGINKNRPFKSFELIRIHNYTTSLNSTRSRLISQHISKNKFLTNSSFSIETNLAQLIKLSNYSNASKICSSQWLMF